MMCPCGPFISTHRDQTRNGRLQVQIIDWFMLSYRLRAGRFVMCAPLSKLYPFNHLNLSLKHCSVNMQMDKADSIIAEWLSKLSLHWIHVFRWCYFFYFNIPQRTYVDILPRTFSENNKMLIAFPKFAKRSIEPSWASCLSVSAA